MTLVVDVQEKLFPLIADHERIGWNLGRLLEGMNILKVPVLATEQYPQGLGSTIKALQSAIEKNQGQSSSEKMISEKIAFSCCHTEEFTAQLAELKRDQVILVGIETHVCVLQTAYDLLAQGFHVQLIVDAVGSRSVLDRDTAIRRLEAQGVTLGTTESILFELTERAGTPTFKQISQLVRQTQPTN